MRGGLVLFRLDRLLSYECVHCRTKKKATLAASEWVGDWDRLVCHRCYTHAASAERRQVKKVAKQRYPRLPSIVKDHQAANELILLKLAANYRFTCGRCGKGKRSANVAIETADGHELVCRRCYDEAGSQPRPERDLLRRHVPPVAEFFRQAEVPIEYDGGWVVVRGKRAFRAAGLKKTLRGRDWNDLIDRVVFADCPDVLVDAMKRNAAVLGDNVRAYFDRDARAFVLRREEETLGTIRPTRVVIRGEFPVKGNFLLDGEHWGEVARALERRERLAAEQSSELANSVSGDLLTNPAAPWRPIGGPPDGLAPQLVARCLEASADVRLRRRIAYSHRIVLEAENGSISFAPIAHTRSGLTVRFELFSEGARVRGAIGLDGAKDPLPVHVEASASDDLVRAAWCTALLGFAAATCFSIDHVERDRHSDREPTSPWRTGRSDTSRRPEVLGEKRQVLPRRGFWPSHLQPTGAWAKHGPSFVPGHRRRLTRGQKASAEAVQRARLVGITLQPAETWVQPHTRGLADGDELTFCWRPPAAIRASVASHAAHRVEASVRNA